MWESFLLKKKRLAFGRAVTICSKNYPIENF